RSRRRPLAATQHNPTPSLAGMANRVRPLLTSVRHETACGGCAYVLPYPYATSQLWAAAWCLSTAWWLIAMLHAGSRRLHAAPAARSLWRGWGLSHAIVNRHAGVCQVF